MNEHKSEAKEDNIVVTPYIVNVQNKGCVCFTFSQSNLMKFTLVADAFISYLLVLILSIFEKQNR